MSGPGVVGQGPKGRGGGIVPNDDLEGGRGLRRQAAEPPCAGLLPDLAPEDLEIGDRGLGRDEVADVVVRPRGRGASEDPSLLRQLGRIRRSAGSKLTVAKGETKGRVLSEKATTEGVEGLRGSRAVPGDADGRGGLDAADRLDEDPRLTGGLQERSEGRGRDADQADAGRIA